MVRLIDLWLRQLTPLHRSVISIVLSLCSSLCLSTFPLNTCYYCTAEPSKAWCANPPVLTEEYKITEGHWNLCAHVFWMLVCVFVWNRHSPFLEIVMVWELIFESGKPTHTALKQASLSLSPLSLSLSLLSLSLSLLSLSLCVSQGGRRWIGGGLGGSDQRESALVKGGVRERSAESSHRGSSPGKYFRPESCQDPSCRE